MPVPRLFTHTPVMLVAIRIAGSFVLSLGSLSAAQTPPTVSAPRREAARVDGLRRPRYTPTETRAVGQALLNRQIERYGRAADQARERDVRMVVAALKDAAALPELEITPTIVRNPTVNASALPGGFLVVNTGLLDQLQELARREAPTDSAKQRRRAIAYTAAVLGHEIAHVALGHTDEIMDAVRRRGFRLELRDIRDSV